MLMSRWPILAMLAKLERVVQGFGCVEERCDKGFLLYWQQEAWHDDRLRFLTDPAGFA